MKDIVRVIRILVYEGTRDKVEFTLSKGGVPANGRSPNSYGLRITSMTLSEFPEVVGVTEEEKEKVDD